MVIALTAAFLPASADAAVVSLYNQSFEDPKVILDPDTLPKPTGWIWTGPNGAGTTFERIEDPTAPDGRWTLKVTTDGSEGLGGVHSPSSDVAPNQTHTIRMMVKVPPGRSLWPAISERTADDEQLDSSYFDEGPALVGTGEWEPIEHSRAFGPIGVKIRAYFRMGELTPGIFYLDAMPGTTRPPAPPTPGQPDSVTPAGGPPVQFVDRPPRVIGFELTRSRFAALGGSAPARVKRGTHFLYTISKPAQVTIAITRTRPAKRTIVLRVQAKAGQQSVAFAGRGPKKPLPPGPYRARLVAKDTAGQTSTPRFASFRIVGGG